MIGCGSSVSRRGVQALSMTLLNRSICIPEFPNQPDIVGRGLTDWKGYTGLLAKSLSTGSPSIMQRPSSI